MEHLQKLIPVEHQHPKVLVTRLEEVLSTEEQNTTYHQDQSKLQNCFEKLIPLDHRYPKVLMTRMKVATKQKKGRIGRRLMINVNQVPPSYENRLMERLQAEHEDWEDSDVQQCIKNLWMEKTPEERRSYLEFESNLPL